MTTVGESSTAPRHAAASTHPLGPLASDADLLAWRQAASTGELPVPIRERWQQLRGGVVNMWEFDVEEYWCADGRAQFVGGNETGKSTLMGLTTLIMFDGSLDRSNIDTFGQQHKSFRYYLEPTEGPKDRRDTNAQTNRGWTWVEYGRLVDGEPEYFTLLLYGQTKRGVAEFTRTWVTCTGAARVRGGITLVRGHQVLTPADLGDVPGLERHPSGGAYKQTVTSTLFGFADGDRMDSMIGMLKVLRTPQLGQRLDPSWFTDQMRKALPGIDRTEIDELAEGWDQLDRLARDRDSAGAARDAVKTYLRKAWNPWADAVLRRAADDLAAATTAFDDVTRRYRVAKDQLEKAEKYLDARRDQHKAARVRWQDLADQYDALIKSQAYANAQSATERVERLSREAASLRRRAEQLEGEVKDAAAKAQRSAELLEEAEREAAEARGDRDASAQLCRDAFEAAGIERATEWVEVGDVERLKAATTERRAHIERLRSLFKKTRAAEAAQERVISLHDAASEREEERSNRAARADAAAEAALQLLSNELEEWVVGLPEAPPEPDLRESWLDAVIEQAASTNPRAVLRSRINADWLTPTVEPLAADAAVARARAKEADQKAHELDGQADARERETDPTPSQPLGWSRRPRPAPATDGAKEGDEGPVGAPLWRLLDPVDGLDGGVLTRVEAALAGAGLLDAWVTPDRVWVPDRDGDDAVVTISAGAGTDPSPSATADLSSVLRPAADAGELTATIADFLTKVAFAEAGASLESAYAVGADGRWRTPVTSGRAAAEHEDASLLGAAARAAARQRAVASLRAQAQELREQAAALRVREDEVLARVRALRGTTPPSDDEVVATARAAAIAAKELEDAAAETLRLEGKAREAEAAANDARADALNFAADNGLPTDDTLGQVESLVNTASDRAQELRTALKAVDAAQRRRIELSERAKSDEETVAGRRTEAEAADTAARRAATEFATAQASLGVSEQDLLAKATTLNRERDDALKKTESLSDDVQEQVVTVQAAKDSLSQHGEERKRTEKARAAALEAWWVPVDGGLAKARGLDEAAGRSVTPALAQARQAREKLRPRGWVEGRDKGDARDAIVTKLLTNAVGNELGELNVVLEATGGRTATTVTSDDPRVLPQVTILVDASGVAVDPTTAVTLLDEKAAELARVHDEKLNSVLEELLSSTFVEHLRDRMTGVMRLLKDVNKVLIDHPTGARKTVLRLEKVPAEDKADGYHVLETLVGGMVDSPAVQEEVRRFLARQIRDAQELGAETNTEWKEHLATLLDFRRWFDVIAEFKILTDEKQRGWKALTKEIHGQDSGGAKVVTLLQPLLATLVAMYDECDSAPRPLWLDEAFEGVDADNRSTMLDLFVDFDLDFLLAGPGTLVASANVPAAAVWFVHKAPGAEPGVSLSLMLWAGNELAQLNTPELRWHDLGPPSEAGDGSAEEGLWG